MIFNALCDQSTTAIWRTNPMIRGELEGPSKTIIVEPMETPAPAPEPLPERTPEPVREPEKVPA